MNEVFRKGDLEAGRIGEFKFMGAPGDGEVRELVATRGFIGAAKDFKAAGAAIPVDGLFKVGDANTGMIK